MGNKTDRQSRRMTENELAVENERTTKSRQIVQGRPAMRSRLFKTITLVVVLVMCLTMLSACSSKPFDTVRKFADAYNKLDYNKLVECYDPRITQALSGVANGVSGLFGLPSTDSDSAAAASSLIGDLMGEYAQQYWDERGVSATMSVKELSTEMNGDDKAKVTVQFTVEVSTGERQTWQETLSMVKIEGKWYITIGLSDIGSLFGS